MLIQHSRRRDAYSIALDAATKLKLQYAVQQLRDLINKESMPPPKRERLLACLNTFQAELDRERTDLQVYGALACEAANTADEAAGAFQPVLRRIGKMLGLLRETEDARDRGRQLATPPERKQIEAPKRPVSKRATFEQKIDDEIPF